MSKNIELIQSALEGFRGCRVLHVSDTCIPGHAQLAAAWFSLDSMQAIDSLAGILRPFSLALSVVNLEGWDGPIFCIMGQQDADKNSEIAFAIQAHNVEQVAQKTFEHCSPASELVM